uniref:Uncharacterized protein n=1 Tax=Lates calcarifer TaxID=8187 RepID=A0A4W6CUF1_LATCA
MASFKKSFESLKGTSHSAAKGVTDSAAAQEASKQTQAAIEKAADKATGAIKEFGQKLETK